MQFVEVSVHGLPWNQGRVKHYRGERVHGRQTTKAQAKGPYKVLSAFVVLYLSGYQINLWTNLIITFSISELYILDSANFEKASLMTT